MARGEGLGQGGTRQGIGPARKCRCPKCGCEKEHVLKIPCTHYICPKCKSKLIGV